MGTPILERGRCNAFTLTELLVVVAIIVVLATFTMSLFRSLSASAATAQCIQNLKHIYTSTLSFVADYNGLLPPDLGGERDNVDPRFNYQQYWWEQAYLGRYTSGKLNRKSDSTGALTEAEVRCYRCPARLQEGPDSDWVQSGNNKFGVSYVMLKRGDRRERYLFHSLSNKSTRLYVTEGRHSTIDGDNSKTAKLGSKSSSRRLRRYHKDAMNILFLDGHISLFSGADEELEPFLKVSNNN